MSRIVELEALNFGGCKSLKKILEGFGVLTCLKYFEMRDCKALVEYPTVDQIFVFLTIFCIFSLYGWTDGTS